MIDTQLDSVTIDDLARMVARGFGEMDKNFSEVRKDIRDIKQDVSVLKQDVSVLKQDVSGLKQELKEFRSDFNNLEEKVDKTFLNHGNRIRRVENKLQVA